MVKCNRQIAFTMNKFTTKQGVLFYSYTTQEEEKQKLDRYLRLLESSGVGKILQKHETRALTGRPQYNVYSMFATVLYGFAKGCWSLRQLEECCRYDIRFMYLMDNETPSYVSFCTFINTVIKPDADHIFAAVTARIMKEQSLTMDDCFIDGTKIEADANKFKFVWKPITFHKRLGEKARNLIRIAGLCEADDNPGELITSVYLADRLRELHDRIMSLNDADEINRLVKMAENLEAYLMKACEYEEKERICGPNRNSYYKTDHDATAMCLKRDYYSGLGSNMHAAYQVQSAVCCGYICSYAVTQDRSDTYCFIPTLERFRKMHGFYPSRVCADAGYGCLDNYRFCDDNGITAFIKYMSWEGESTGRRPAVYELNDDDTITCLGNRKGQEVSIPDRHPKKAGSVFYRVDGCTGCDFMPYCRQFMTEKVADFKIFEVNRDFIRYRQQARDLLLSVEGIEMRVNRSCQVEGCFGIMKQDFSYDRFRRTGLERVATELMLTALGMNIRKYMRNVAAPKVWTAPEGTLPQVFKKPSAKRLANRVAKKKPLQPNEQARKGYKYN